MSSSVDVSDSTDAARTRLLRTARAINRTWAAALCAMVLLALAALAALVVATTFGAVYVVTWSALLAAAGANVTRFWPRRRTRAGVPLTPVESAELLDALDPRRVSGRAVSVELTTESVLDIDGTVLRLGMPLLSTLERSELRELLLVADHVATVDDVLAVRWADRVAHGEVGRSLVGRSLVGRSDAGRRRGRRTGPGHWLARRLRTQAGQLEVDRAHWVEACRRAAIAASGAATRALVASDHVHEAWEVVRVEWLEPALEQGRRHQAPFTGLRHFLEGADAQGWLGHPGPWLPSSGVLAELAAGYESALADEVAGEARAGCHRIDWSEHPNQVTLPWWRSLVSEVVDADRRATRESDVPTLETVLSIFEAGRGPALAEHTATERGLGRRATDAWRSGFALRTLTAAISVAAADSQLFRLSWTWPTGTSLAADDGWTLPVEGMVAEVLGMIRDGAPPTFAFGELRDALVELGIDADEQLWLDHPGDQRPERPVGSFVARSGLVSRLVVVTEDAVHVFRDADGPRLDRLVRRFDPRDDSFDQLRARMLAVWQGDTTDEVAVVAADEVVRARFGPAIGGIWWRLVVTGTGRGLVLRGRGDGLAEETALREWLGDRLTTSWLHASPRLRAIRSWLGRGGVGVGVLALLASLALGAIRPGGIGGSVSLVLAVCGLAALVLALLPDLLGDLLVQVRQSRSSPTGTSTSTELPRGASGHAHEESYAQDGA